MKRSANLLDLRLFNLPLLHASTTGYLPIVLPPIPSLLHVLALSPAASSSAMLHRHFGYPEAGAVNSSSPGPLHLSLMLCFLSAVLDPLPGQYYITPARQTITKTFIIPRLLFSSCLSSTRSTIPGQTRRK